MTGTTNPTELIDGLWNADLLATVALAAVLGMLGGLLPRTAAAAQPNPAPPAATDDGKPEKPWVRVVRRATVGAVAAVLILYLQDVTKPLVFITGSLVAGYAGSSVLASIESRLLAGLAQRDLGAARTETAALRLDARQLVDHTEAALAACGTDAPPVADRAQQAIASFKLRHLT